MSQHFLITRFNLRLVGLAEDRRRQPVLTHAWMEDRLDLFERVCAPSVAHQSNSDFVWLILLDSETDAGVVERVEAAIAGIARAELVFLPAGSDDSTIAGVVRERVDDATDLLLTTRLDNDDALHEEALAVVRGSARPGRREFLNLKFGWVTDGVRARAKAHKYGHFATLVEPRAFGHFRTVHCGLSHGRVRRFAPVRQLSGGPYWMEVIHGRNVSNRMVGEPRAHSVTTPLALHRWFRYEIVAPARRLAWPRRLRGTHALSDVAPRFHIRWETGSTDPVSGPGD